MNEKTDAKGLIVKVSFSLPFCIYIEDNSYEVQMPSYIAIVNTKRKKQEHLDPRLFIAEATTELKQDRHGWLRYTDVEIALTGQAVIERETKKRISEEKIQTKASNINISVNTDQLISEYSQAALEEGMVVANYFIAVYREASRDFYIKTFSKDEIYHATISWYSENELLGGTNHMSFGKGMTLEPIGLLPEIDQQFKQRLKVYNPPSLFAELILNARDYLELRNYRMAVVESRTCIEVFIDQILETEFTRRGTGIEEVKKILDVVNRKDVQDIEDALENASINSRLKKGLKYVLGKGLNEDIDLWQKWLKAKKNREKAVHKAIDISEAEAENAVDTLSRIFEFIIKQRIK